MSLFGSKPLFGSTAATGASSGFTFGSTATTTSAPSLFGTTTTTSSTSKPLFGSVPQSGTTTSLFGSTTTTSGSLFGTKTVTTTAGGGLFGSSTTGGLFSKPTTTGFGSTGGAGLFGSKPMTGGLFGSTLVAQPAVETKQTFQGILQDSDALVRSLTKVELFGDERDEMIAKLNQLAAAMGVGCGYYKDGQQPVQYSQLGPFHRIKGIGYNRTSEYTESDGIVALVVKAPFSEYQTSEQKQKFVDVLFVILGNKPTVHAHIESVRALPDNCTEICIYVTEKFRGRITSRELSQYLNQAPQKQQLESQLKVDKERIVSRVQMDKRQKELYLKDPPTGFDASLWAQAVRENADPERLVPYPIRGFEQLRTRQKVLIENVDAQNAVVDSMNSKIGRIEANVSAVAVHFARQKVIQKQLSHRLLRVLSMQLMSQRFTQGFDAREESVQSALESINARLNAPQQIKSRITEISETLRANDATLRSSASKDTGFIDEADALSLKKYLDRCQDGLESLVAVMSLFEDEKKLEKRAKSEAQRVESIRAKKLLEQQRQAILSQALRDVDNRAKRIVFTDSDDDEENATSSRTETASFPSAQVKLFEDDSSDDNNVESSFTITCSHEGKKGEKLMKLEARFNSDPRFKLDEKFASSGSDDDNADEAFQERAKNLEVLSKVLGSTVEPLKRTIKSMDKAAGEIAAVRPFTRFDPFNEEHISWLKKNQVASEIRKGDVADRCSVDDSRGNEKMSETHIEMRADFIRELKSRSSGQGNGVDGGDGFSFLEMIGRRPTVDGRHDTINHNANVFPVKKQDRIKGTDNDYGCNGITLGKFGQPVEQAVSIGAKFFVSGDEPHLQSLINNFKRTQSLEKIVSRWANHRDIFSKSAYSTLSDTHERQCYDAWLDCILPLSYGDFKRNQDAVKVSMHWAAKKETPMISMSNVEKQGVRSKEHNSSSLWEDRYQSDVVRKFRNYEL
ncbi:hypothetical protein Angca_006822 [Angiostrongylus cantonensis]|nr:hypothetical protein Angca_006822 [Angiostrongylus cantonensis]